MTEQGERARVTIVVGPPGAGKTTLVRERARAGDLIVDVDALYHALGGLPWYDKPIGLLPYVLAARDAVLEQLQKPAHIYRAWVITASGDRAQLQALQERLDAAVIALEVSPSECMRRIMRDERRARQADQWEALVARWWREWERIYA